MEKIITYENLRSFTYSNDKICTQPIRGIVIDHCWLGQQAMHKEDPAEGKLYAENGILFLIPYSNPWGWMNRQALAFAEEILDVVMEHYNLPDNTPIVSTGTSMGGLATLVYTRYAKRTPVACVANCPVCDLVYHFTERPDLPRTIYSAFFNYEGTMEDALKLNSPLHLAKEMPDTEYTLFHGDADTAVNIHKHSERFVEAMKETGHRITYYVDPNRNHNDLTPEMNALLRKTVLDAINKYSNQ